MRGPVEVVVYPVVLLSVSKLKYGPAKRCRPALVLGRIQEARECG